MALDLSRLNPNQREAVLHGNGPLLVLAGAGSGKTSTMTYRIAHLIAERNIPSFAILGLSFTNKAAAELKGRVSEMITKVAGRNATRGLTVSTFHSLCVRILREHAGALGFQNNFTIVDQSDQKDMLRQVFKNVRIDDRKFDLDTILFEISQAKSRFLRKEEAESYFFERKSLAQDYQIALASSYGHYQAQLRALNAMDFDDLLYYGVELLEHHADVRDHYNLRFRQILVDEYQDTNPTQFRLLRLLTQRHQNICVVGDDDQSIYSWRGADATHILEFAHHFPGARTITLDQNYRSTNTILEAANHVIANNTKRHPKKLWSDRGSGSALTEVIVEEDRAEAEFVSNELTRRARDENRPWKDFAVLYRSNTQSRIFEEAFRRYGIPYKIVGGYSFLDLKEVKDVLSYWRLIVNPKDDASLRRIINWPARTIGKGTIEMLGNHAFQHHVSMFEALTDAPRLVTRSAAPVIAFRDLIQGLRDQLEKTPPTPEAMVDWARHSLTAFAAKKAIEEEEEDAVKAVRRWDNVEELLHSLGQIRPEDLEIAEQGGVSFLQEFLGRMALNAKDEEEDKKDDKQQNKDELTLLTLHGSKGLEYPVVFIVGCEEGFLPHKRTIEEAQDFSEERRLAYVGITRARDHLILVRARNRLRYGKPVPRYRSRFLDEIPAGVIMTRDESHGPDKSDSKEAQEKHEERVKGFLSGILSMLEHNKSH